MPRPHTVETGEHNDKTFTPSRIEPKAIHHSNKMTKDKNKNSRIVVVGAGIFGLSIAHQLASEGYKNVIVLDRHMPPVPPSPPS